VIAGRTAATYLNNVGRAAARGVPDLFGSLAGSIEEAAGFGLLADVPCAKVAVAMVKLIASLSPIAEIHGPRSCTLWLTHLLDREIQRELRRATPESFRVSTPTPTPVGARPSSHYKKVIAELEAQNARLRAANFDIATCHNEAVRLYKDRGVELQEQVRERDLLEVEAAKLHARNDELLMTLGEYRELDRSLEGVRRAVAEINGLRHATQEAEVRAQRAEGELREVRGELAKVRADLVEARARDDSDIAPGREAQAECTPEVEASSPERKIGRNTRCPCGSGKKYKRCCGA